MKLAACAVLFAVSAPVFAADITAPEAKVKATRLLETMNKVEIVATLDRVLNDPDAYAKHFQNPLNKETGSWPVMWNEPENKAIRPYKVCFDAAMSLSMLAEARRKTGDSMAKPVVKHRGEYQSKKARCTQETAKQHRS